MIYQYEPYIKPSWAEAVKEQILSGWVGPGKTVKKFEECFAAYIGTKKAVSTTSGSAALLTALYSYDIGPGDEVIVSNYSFIAAVNCVRFLRATPILVDIKIDTLCMDPELIEEKITKNTKAIIFINHNGYAGIDAFLVRGICDKYNIPMIEDAACGLGIKYNSNCNLGALGDISCFSFSVPKILESGQGGMIIPNSKENRCREIIDQGSIDWRNNGGYHYNSGINLKYNDILASFALSQLEEIEELLERRRVVYNRYKKNKIPIYSAQAWEDEGPWFICYYSKNVEVVYKELEKNGVQSKFLYPPIHKSLKKEEVFINTEKVYKNVLYLPSSLSLKDKDVDFICNIIRRTDGL